MKRINRNLLYTFVWAAILYFPWGCSLFSEDCEEITKKYESLHAGYSTIHDTEKVYEECKDDLRKCPKLSLIYELMARIDYDSEYYEDALENYGRALRLSPDDPLLEKKVDDLRDIIRDEREREKRQARIEREEEERYRMEMAAREREREAHRQRQVRIEREEQWRLEREEMLKKAEERRRKREAARRRAMDNKRSAIGDARR